MSASQHRRKTLRANHVLDARTLTVGRLASTAVRFLTGKHKPSYQPYRDDGDCVTITHAGNLRFTGSKPAQKVYYDMSRYPGGIHTRRAGELMSSNPAEIVRRAVTHMLPKNRHRQERMKRLQVNL